MAQTAYEQKGRTNSAGRASHDLAPSWRGYTTLVWRWYHDWAMLPTLVLSLYCALHMLWLHPIQFDYDRSTPLSRWHYVHHVCAALLVHLSEHEKVKSSSAQAQAASQNFKSVDNGNLAWLHGDLMPTFKSAHGRGERHERGGRGSQWDGGVRLLSSKAWGCKDFWKPSKPCHVGIHRIALAKFSQMSTHVPGVQSFLRFFASFCIGQSCKC